MLYISEIHLKNIRCFKTLNISLYNKGKSTLWTTFLGDNSTGKTTLLRSIAMGLCDESSAAGLLRESEEGFIRRDEKEGSIIIKLRDPNKPNAKRVITTILKRVKVGDKNSFEFENLRQETRPKRFPWNDIFVCAYGIGRGVAGTGDISGYSAIDAVYNLFNYSEGLQNPELVLLRLIERKGKKEKNVLENLEKILGLAQGKHIHREVEGIKVDDPLGNKIPLGDLADGYKSTFQWLMDFMGWAISYKPENPNISTMQGIVLVDAIDQHLHPNWQKKIVNKLRNSFKKIQFITTTHSPIIAGNASKLYGEDLDSKQFHLRFEDGAIGCSEIEENLGELNYDQVLSSEAFLHLYNINEKVEKFLKCASLLAAKDKRTKHEERKFEEIKKFLKEIMFPEGKTLPERLVERDYYNELEKKIEDFKKKWDEKND